jgi:hypothetical protein
VDVAGAESLRQRLEQQAHWRLAEAVCDGRQMATDPDIDELETMEYGRRIYAARLVHGKFVRLHKELSDGVWVSHIVPVPALEGAEVPDDALVA